MSVVLRPKSRPFSARRANFLVRCGGVASEEKMIEAWRKIVLFGSKRERPKQILRNKDKFDFFLLSKS
jgi:hypothetical protein